MDTARPINIIEISDRSSKLAFPTTQSAGDTPISVMNNTVQEYCFDLSKPEFTQGKALSIDKSGFTVGITERFVLYRKGPKYSGARYIKTSRNRGPFEDVFTDAYVVVYGTYSRCLQHLAVFYKAESVC